MKNTVTVKLAKKKINVGRTASTGVNPRTTEKMEMMKSIANKIVIRSVLISAIKPELLRLMVEVWIVS